MMAEVTQIDIQEAPVTTEPLLTATPMALAKIRELLQQRDLPGYALRVFVQGGGCSGLSYGMAFENSYYPQDSVLETDGIRLVIDPTSLAYMRGAEIDFVDSLMGGGFAINNPNAVSSCGCGHSFRTSDTASDTSDAASGCGSGCGCGGH
jgi:iron-sulfur cluster assembly accessory protein